MKLKWNWPIPGQCSLSLWGGWWGKLAGTCLFVEGGSIASHHNDHTAVANNAMLWHRRQWRSRSGRAAQTDGCRNGGGWRRHQYESNEHPLIPPSSAVCRSHVSCVRLSQPQLLGVHHLQRWFHLSWGCRQTAGRHKFDLVWFWFLVEVIQTPGMKRPRQGQSVEWCVG